MSSIRKNTIMMTLYEIFGLILPLITTPIVTRSIQNEGIGVFSFSSSIIMYFSLVVQLGIKIYGKREITKLKAKNKSVSSFFSEILTLQFLLVIVVSVIYILFCYVMKTMYSSIIMNALIIQFLMIPASFLDVSWYYFGIESYKAILLRNLSIRLLTLLSILLFVKDSSDILMYCFLMVLSNLIGSLTLWIGINKEIHFQIPSIRKVIFHLLPMLKLFIPVLSTQLFVLINKTLLGSIGTIEEVGMFENAYKISRIPISIISSFSAVMMPVIIKLLVDNRIGESKKYIEKSLNYVMFISVPISLGFFSIANVFIPIYLGQGNEKTIIAFQILSFSLIFLAWGNIFRTQYLLPLGKDQKYIELVTYSSFLNIIFAYFLIDKYGVYGASLASLFSEIIICIYTCIIVKEEFNFLKLLTDNTVYFLSGIIMVICIYFIYWINNFYTLIVRIVFGAIVYVICVLFFEKIWRKDIITSEIMKFIRTKK